MVVGLWFKGEQSLALSILLFEKVVDRSSDEDADKSHGEMKQDAHANNIVLLKSSSRLVSIETAEGQANPKQSSWYALPRADQC